MVRVFYSRTVGDFDDAINDEELCFWKYCDAAFKDPAGRRSLLERMQHQAQASLTNSAEPPVTDNTGLHDAVQLVHGRLSSQPRPPAAPPLPPGTISTELEQVQARDLQVCCSQA